MHHPPLDLIVRRLLQLLGLKEHLLAGDHSLPKLAMERVFGMDNLQCPHVSDFSNSMVASDPVEAEADHSNGNNHAQYEASRSVPNSIAMTEYSRNNYSNMVTRTVAAGVTDNPSTLVANTSENEKKNKAVVTFLFTIVDKMSALNGGLSFWGVVYSHGPTPLLRISDAWIQVLFAGGMISIFSCIILAGPASYFKEIGSPDHPGFVVCSMMVLFELLFLLMQTCIILLGFERSSKYVIWSFGVLLLLPILLVWVSFQHEPMILGLKSTKNALEWMIKSAKIAFVWMKAKISKWRPRDESLPQMQA